MPPGVTRETLRGRATGRLVAPTKASGERTGCGGPRSPRAAVVAALFLVLALAPGRPVGAADGDAGDAGRTPASSPQPAAASAAAGNYTVEGLLELHHAQTQKVRLVLLPTSVTDRRGRLVGGLDPEDFQVFEDAVPQRIRVFSAEANEPLSVVFLLDVSGSMRQLGRLRSAKDAVRLFVEQLQPQDKIALICFADRQVSWVTEFTRDRKRFLARLAVQEGYGQTALHDAVAAAPALVRDQVKGRKAIVLITDGVDNFSRLSLAQATEIARRVNVPIYTIGFVARPIAKWNAKTTASRLQVLASVSSETGGRLLAVHRGDEVQRAAAAIQDELRRQYVIGYYPERAPMVREFRTIRVEMARRKLEARTRTGYYATP